MAQEKVIVRFESTLDSANSPVEPLLLSGPIQIFASVDYLRDPTVITDENRDKVGLNNHGLLEAISESNESEIIVFVNEVQGANSNSQRNRGAYFRYVGDRSKILSQVCVVEDDWKEILLGTHSHANKEQLDSLTNIQYSEEVSNKDKIVAMGDDGNFKLIDNVSSKHVLPDLPFEVQNNIKELEIREKIEGIEEPDENEGHHLDAKLKYLRNTYDWLVPDENGNYSNLSYGNCKDLYNALTKSPKKLYLNQNSETGELYITRDESLVYIDLQVYEAKFEVVKNRYNIEIDAPFKTSNDEIFIFIEDRYISSDYYTFSILDNKKLQVSFMPSRIERDDAKLTLLFLKNLNSSKITRGEVIESIAREEIYLNDINNKLVELYIEAELNKKVEQKTFYLSTDMEGNIEWNSVLPAQHFYSGSIKITQTNISEYTDENGNIQFTFPDVYFDDKSVALLLADNYFAFDLKFDEELSKPGNYKDLVYVIKKTDETRKYIDWTDDYFNHDYKKDDDEFVEFATEFKLIVIKNSAGGSLAAEIANKYVSKEDAVSILSHGRISLQDYAKATDLINLSRVGHTHKEYAPIDHDHDHQYANFMHTHPEMSELFARLLESNNAGSINSWIESLGEEHTNKVITAALADLNTRNIDGNKILIPSNIKNVIENFVEVSKIEPEGDLNYLDDVLVYMFTVLQQEISPDRVVFNYNIPVKFKVGGITKNMYENATLEEIIRDILNPFVSAETIREEYLTPDREKTRNAIEWFRVSPSDEIYKVDPSKLKFDNYSGQLLFKINLKNRNGGECSYEYTNGYDKETRTVKPFVEEYDKYNYDPESPYYVYSREFDFSGENTDYPEITIRWSDIVVYDNYNQNGVPLITDENAFIDVQPEFTIIFSEYLVGSLSDIEFKDASELETLHSYIGDHVINVTLNDNGEENLNKFIAILMDTNIEDFEFTEMSSKTDITTFFEYQGEQTVFGRSYNVYTYEVLNSLIQNIEIGIRVNTKEGGC